MGTSGAIFGLGAMLSELITNWSIHTNKAVGLFTLLFTIVINLALGCCHMLITSSYWRIFLTGFLPGFILLLRPSVCAVRTIKSPCYSPQVKIQGLSICSMDGLCHFTYCWVT
ncbi:hypothetical protein AAZV13_09G113500 [Glycine max]